MATKTQQRASASGAGRSGRTTARRRRTATVHLPLVTAEFRAPELHLPSVRRPALRVPAVRVPALRMPQLRMPPIRMPQRSDLDGAVSTVRPYLPSAEQAGLYAGLAAMGVLELVEWPVALAIAAAAAITRHTSGEGRPARRGGARPEPTTAAGSETRTAETRTAETRTAETRTATGTRTTGTRTTETRGATGTRSATGSRTATRSQTGTRSSTQGQRAVSGQRGVPRQRSARSSRS